MSTIFENTWNCSRWKDPDAPVFEKKGLHFFIKKGVDPEVRRAILEFAGWLRTNYIFPARVNVYVFSDYYIRASNGEMVYATCMRPGDDGKYPYIRMSTGDYEDLVKKRGTDDALAAMLYCAAKMLTHYFQWLNDMDYLTERQEEQQANRCARKILDDYAQTRDHP